MPFVLVVLTIWLAVRACKRKQMLHLVSRAVKVELSRLLGIALYPRSIIHSKSIYTQQKERGQYSAILTEQTWPITIQ